MKHSNVLGVAWTTAVVGVVVCTTIMTNSVVEAQNTTSNATTISFDDCDPDVYYAGLLATTNVSTSWLKDDVRSLLIDTHRNELPNIGVNDITSAMIALWPGATADTVHLVYSNIDVPSSPANTPESWRREHLWPDTRGLSTSSKSFTDVHSKAPADWSVLLKKGALFFGTCGTVEDEAMCVTPATDETAADTSQDGKIWTPPEEFRGDIARAIFYTALRYEEELGLSLSDCPPFQDTQFGYLSSLLRWHQADPVSEQELNRTANACSNWQGNRNVFVDYPELVAEYFGPPDSIREGTRYYSSCMVTTEAPTATPNDCSSLQAGDIMPYVFNSEAPDQIVFYPLNDIPASVESLYLTDQAWNGTDFVPGEGTIEYLIPDDGLAPGSTFGYGVQLAHDKGEWKVSENNMFDLAVTGDNFFLYCLNADNIPHFLSGLSYAGAFQSANLTTDQYGFNTTALPAALTSVGSVALPFFPNYLYNGTVDVNSKENLVKALSDPNSWSGSSMRYDIDTSTATTTMSRPILFLMTASVSAAMLLLM